MSQAVPDALVSALARRASANPDDAEACAALAARQWELGEHAEAIGTYAALAARRPDDAAVALRLGMAMVLAGQPTRAVAVLEPVVARAPGLAAAHEWLGRALALVHWYERGPQAVGPLRDAVAARPGDADRHTALATALLSCGSLAEAWPHYAWRWASMAGTHARAPADPHARPDPAGWRGRRVLLFAEQGFGDTLQFLRYVPMVVAAGAEVILEVPGPLRRLAATVSDRVTVVARGEAVPAHDTAVPLMHLPWAFGTTLATIPARVPYLAVPPEDVAAWRARLSGLAGLKVGLVWAGASRPDNADAHRIDRRRSTPLAMLAPLVAVPGVDFVSLQVGEGAAQAGSAPAGLVLHDVTGELGDFADTAALMAALDLVISVDTAPAHLAGALARPVWLLNRYDFLLALAARTRRQPVVSHVAPVPSGRARRVGRGDRPRRRGTQAGGSQGVGTRKRMPIVLKPLSGLATAAARKATSRRPDMVCR